MDIDRKTFRRLVDTHNTRIVGERCGFTTDYISAIYRGSRECGRGVMLALRREFPDEFSADDDLDAEIKAETATPPGGC